MFVLYNILDVQSCVACQWSILTLLDLFVVGQNQDLAFLYVTLIYNQKYEVIVYDRVKAVYMGERVQIIM